VTDIVRLLPVLVLGAAGFAAGLLLVAAAYGKRTERDEIREAELAR
jgi:hypothetical protein